MHGVICITFTQDEITRYQAARWIGTHEAIWRLLGFPLDWRYPAVQSLAVHAEHGEHVLFRDDTDIQTIQPPLTTLTAFITYNNECYMDRTRQAGMPKSSLHLRYADMPTEFTWHNNNWKPRKHTTTSKNRTIGRMRLLPASAGEEYYLRAILCVIKGKDATSWTALKTVDNQYVILKFNMHLINSNTLQINCNATYCF